MFRLAVLAALMPSAASAQVRAIPRLAAPYSGVTAPARLTSGLSSPRTPGLLSILPAPTLAAPAPKVGLQAAPMVQALAAPGPAPVEPEAPGEDNPMAAAMIMQSQILGTISRATGFDPLTLSLGMSMLRQGLTIKDWLDVGAGLQNIDSDWDEMDKVLAHQVRSSQFSEQFREGTNISPDDLVMLSLVIKELPQEVEIARNSQYLGWRYDWEAGKASAAGASFQDASVKRVSADAWMLDLGVAPGPGGAQRLRVTLHTLGERHADAKPQLDALLASPLLTSEQKADLLRLAEKLEKEGLLPAGYAKSRA
ncbi:MAG: hypothetical protein HY926_00660 [Elusimicrobia bacterium]|nr:hypothetical protein [Elusimicrobiota bacterium]